MDAKGTVRARLPATAGSLPLSYASRERRERKYPVLKSSFAYCASRRRVFGPANNGGLPLSTSLSLSLSAPSRLLRFRTRVLDHAHASRTIIADERRAFLEARAREGSNDPP